VKAAELDDGPPPQPERRERNLADPRLRDLSRRDLVAILKRAGRRALDDNVTDSAAALAYYAFLALPSALLVSLGLFALLAGQRAVDLVMERVSSVIPTEAVSLLRDSLERVSGNQSGGIAMVAVGSVLAVWSATGAMTALMHALNQTYDRRESRGFVAQRLTALGMLVLTLIAFALAFGLLVLGPHLSRWVGRAVGMESAVSWIWWTAQWPVLLGGLLLAFGGLLYLGPDVRHPRRSSVTPGSLVATLVWLAASGLFAVYVGMFDSYDKTWGSLAAVIVMLTWLWLTAVALLLGAEVNAEVERSRELRRGEPARRTLRAPARG
jgi:membrane protein